MKVYRIAQALGAFDGFIIDDALFDVIAPILDAMGLEEWHTEEEDFVDDGTVRKPTADEIVTELSELAKELKATGYLDS